ncbi:MAG: tetratricopeptide repeat protein [Limisphaerales bacterium]
MASPYLRLSLLLAICFTLAVRLQSWFMDWGGNRADSAGVLSVVLGDSRRLFANHFFVKADAYFHSGYYPGVFDQTEAHAPSHMTENAGGAPEPEHEAEADFLEKPRDWIDRFGRNFFPTQHTHLERGEERELLPWLRLSAELDPHRVETYTVAAYWLRTRLGRVNEAEAFLREGLRANPNSCEILFELGRVYDQNRHDPDHARNLWELALRRWKAQQAGRSEPDTFLYAQITGRLAGLESRAGNDAKAITYLEMLQKVSPNPGKIQDQINDLKKRLPTPNR